MSLRMECGVCWHVYDPDEGDELRQIDPGTGFGSLPEDWHCPRCDAPRSKFLPVEAGQVDVVTELRRAFQHVGEAKMRGLPVFNQALDVETVGFRSVEGGELGVLVTPWFMSVAFIPTRGDFRARLTGESETELEIGGNRYRLLVSEVPGVGPVATLGLLSPMDEVSSQEAARAAAEAAIEELLLHASADGPESSRDLGSPGDRRRFLRGAWG